MPIKKSALLLIMLSAGSVSLLVYASGITPAEPVTTVIPVECPATNSCSQINESKTYAPAEMISRIMLRSAA